MKLRRTIKTIKKIEKKVKTTLKTIEKTIKTKVKEFIVDAKQTWNTQKKKLKGKKWV